MVIYIDILIALNLFIDFLLLSACSYILKLPRKRWRMAAGAVAGGAFSCTVLLNIPAAANVFLGIIAAALIIRIAFVYSGWKPFFKQLVLYYIISVIFAGVCFAIWHFAAPQGFTVIRGVVYYDIPPVLLASLTAVSYLVIYIYDRITRKKLAKNGQYRLTVDCGAGAVTLNAMYDTGHHVRDVFTGSPVAIVSRAALNGHMPRELTGLLDGGEESLAAVSAGLRMIPCRTISGRSLLPAFKPKSAQICLLPKARADVSGIYLAVSVEFDAEKYGYDAIIGTDIAEKITPKGRFE